MDTDSLNREERGAEHACKVCGDRASGRHYGVQSCDGCRGFFKRSIRRNLQYVCKENGQCTVDVARRNQCQACRFTKCLQVNMKREAVQHERAPRTVDRKRSFGDCTDEFQLNHASKENKSVTSFPLAPSASSSAFMSTSTLYPIPSYSLSNSLPASVYGGCNIPIFPYYPSLNSKINKQRSFPDIFLNYGPSSTSHLGDSQRLTFPNSDSNCEHPRNENLYETAARTIFVGIKWAKSIPSFSQVPFRDQMTLLEERWTDLFLFSLAQFPSFLHEGNIQEELTSLGGRYEKIMATIQLIIDLNLDRMEFTCLKTIALLKPDVANLSDKKSIKSLQDQSMTMLDEYCYRQTSSRLRFGRLLLLLSSTSGINRSTIEEMFFYSIIGRIPIQHLICDIFMNA